MLGFKSFILPAATLAVYRSGKHDPQGPTRIFDKRIPPVCSARWRIGPNQSVSFEPRLSLRWIHSTRL